MKKLFLKISQYLQENVCVGVSFNKVVALKVSTWDSDASVFLWIFQIF